MALILLKASVGEFGRPAALKMLYLRMCQFDSDLRYEQIDDGCRSRILGVSVKEGPVIMHIIKQLSEVANFDRLFINGLEKVEERTEMATA